MDLAIDRTEETKVKEPKFGGEIFYLTLNDEGVEVINICDLLGMIYPGYWDNCNFMNYDVKETDEAVINWCKENDAWYYSDMREDFFVFKGVTEAKENNKSVVVVEDLS